MTRCSITDSILGSPGTQGSNYTAFFLLHLQCVVSVSVSSSAPYLSYPNPGSHFHLVLHCNSSCSLLLGSSPQNLPSFQGLISYLPFCILVSSMGAMTAGAWKVPCCKKKKRTKIYSNLKAPGWNMYRTDYLSQS